MESGTMASVGRMLIALGFLLFVAGGVILLAGRIGFPLGRLPGDIAVRGKHVTFYAPIATCLLLSILLSLILWLINHFRR